MPRGNANQAQLIKAAANQVSARFGLDHSTFGYPVTLRLSLQRQRDYAADKGQLG